MARKCTVCQHQQSLEIDRALVAGIVSMRAIASQYALSRSAVANHAATHVQTRLAATQATPGADPAGDMLASLRAADLASCTTLRDHALRDLARLERVIEAGLASGSTAAVMSALRVKYLLLSRSGLGSEPDKLLAPKSEDADPRERRAQALQSAMMRLIDRLGRENPMEGLYDDDHDAALASGGAA